MTRKVVILAIQYAGYHNDKAAGTRILIENAGKISTATYQKEFQVGREMRAAGMKCNCEECTK